ncbi:uncharacterized protein MYCGRDRAFT_106356 [Zymoseptoria tritici IPO323]|uniref:Uncharacterized protein n=1 Tax=Zymoseptoria tritici (strain CBS 115943 / IPO323) TaxID=336722 RepID=F9XNT6_ZYMTI|nr:uncharacterized protein MYCGRDRAFT_106356 [Zymoseptoria tritici IPO323]EGP83112.1 hypothetical protein MYCGRDRAFT_106356 [Zymoseptoria tritici IPO323]
MRLNCFRAGAGSTLDQDDAPRAPRKKGGIRRTGTDQSNASRCSTASNSSISKLPPCNRESNPKIEAMMMPVPAEPRASRCLRLSQPKTYSNIVDSMKATRGCRDWRSFGVFYADEVDMSLPAEDVARRRAADCERKLRMLSLSSREGRPSIDEIDMIG